MKRRSPRTAWIAGLKGTLVAPVLTAAALAGALLVLSGCQVMSPIRTDVAFQPADGVAVDLGDVQIRDLVVIVSAKGEVGTLSGLVVNKGTRPVTITFATGTGDGGDDGAAEAEVLPGEATRLSGVEGTIPVTIPSIDASPGDMIRMTVSTPTAGASEVSVPVLPPTGYYATITPPTTAPGPVPTTTTPGQTTTPLPGQTTTPPPGQTSTPPPGQTSTP